MLRRSVFFRRVLSRNCCGAYFHMLVNLGYQLEYQDLKDIIVDSGCITKGLPKDLSSFLMY